MNSKRSTGKNKFGDISAIRIASILPLNTGYSAKYGSFHKLTNIKGLEVLDLSCNCIGKRGGVAIGQALKSNSALSKLNLQKNGLSGLLKEKKSFLQSYCMKY